MIPCHFCDTRAVYVAVTMDPAWDGRDRIPFCSDHLRTYYLGTVYVNGRKS
jgi:hypothetical protein